MWGWIGSREREILYASSAPARSGNEGEKHTPEDHRGEERRTVPGENAIMDQPHPEREQCPQRERNPRDFSEDQALSTLRDRHEGYRRRAFQVADEWLALPRA